MIRRVTFAGPGGRPWGAGLFGESQGTLVFSADGPAALASAEPVPVRLEAVPDRGWSLEGDGLRLEVAPAGDGVELVDPAGTRAAFARCRVEGSVGGTSLPAEAPAQGLCLEHGPWDSSALDSVRDVMAWFGGGVDYGLLALRPRKAKGHDRDLVLASLLHEPGEPVPRPVDDGRLSSRYDRSGAVTHAGLELWLEEEPVQDEPPGAGSEEQSPSAEVFPHRVAGERIGGPVRLEVPELSLTVSPFIWHSRGRDGLGAYALGRPR